MLQYFRIQDNKRSVSTTVMPTAVQRMSRNADGHVLIRFTDEDTQEIQCDQVNVILHEVWAISFPGPVELWRYGIDDRHGTKTLRQNAEPSWSRHLISSAIVEREFGTNIWTLASAIGAGVPPLGYDRDLSSITILVDLDRKRAMVLDDTMRYSDWTGSLSDVLAFELCLSREQWPEWFGGQPVTDATLDAATGTAG